MPDLQEIKFRDWDENGYEVLLTLWPEKWMDPLHVIGWCPERSNNIIVHVSNVREQEIGHASKS